VKKNPIDATPYLAENKSPVSKAKEQHVKNEDEIDESHKIQLKLKYEVYLVNMRFV